MRSGLASPNVSRPRSSTHGPTASAGSPAAARHSRVHSRQPCGVTCQPCAKASLITVAAAWVRPWYMDGRRAKAYTVRSTFGWPIVT
jgi:hypothetical protein